MRIDRLDLRAFGPFTDEALDLSEGRHGLHILYGPNEAGKSSTLRAIGQGFYGIDQQSRDSFLHSYEKMRVGASLRHGDGSQLDFVRRKAHKQSLRGADDATPLAPEDLQRFLGGADHNVFHTMFGIDHAALVAGGEEILCGGGDLGRTLFAAGTGLTRLRAIQESLQDQLDRLYKKTGKNPAINKALSELTELRDVVKRTQLSSEDWLAHEQALREARDRKERLQVEQKQIQEHLQRLKIRALDEKLAGLHVATELLARADAIEELQRQLGDHQRATHDQATQQALLAGVRGQARDILSGLGRPADVPVEDAVAELARLPVPTDEVVDRFEDDLDEQEQSCRDLTQQLERGRKSLADLDRNLHEVEKDSPVPSEAELHHIRFERDTLWKQLCEAWSSGPNEAATGLAAQLELLVKQADYHADRLRHEADRVAHREGLLAQRQRQLLQVQELENRHAAASAKLDTLKLAWAAQWQPLAMTPRSPRDMRAWLGKRQALLDGFTRTQQRLQEIDAGCVSFTAAARALVQELAPDLLALGSEEAAQKLVNRLAEARTMERTRRTILDRRTRELAGTAGSADDPREWKPLAGMEELQRQCDELARAISQADQTIGREEAALKRMDTSAAAADAAEQVENLTAQLGEDARQFALLRVAAAVLQRSIECYRERNQGPVLQRAGRWFADLTCGVYSGLQVDSSDKGEPVLLARRTADQQTLGVGALSDGTRDQLYLALRLATIEAYLDNHEPLPLIVDDILLNFDDDRAAAALKALAELSDRTQILFFTHHQHLVDLAKAHLPESVVFVHHLGWRPERNGTLF